MVNTVIGKTYTVGEMIDELRKFPSDMPVCSDGYIGIESIEKKTWEHTNYPCNLPDTEFVMIL